MKSERPRIEVPYQTIDLIIELLNIVVLSLIIGYTFINYSELPETIAIHFNAQGEPDGFDNKTMIWLLPGIAIFIFGLMLFINRFPHLHNYMLDINQENALKNYRASSRIVRFANFFCMIVLALVVLEVIATAKGHSYEIFGIPFLIFLLIVPLVGMAVIFIYMKKINI